MSNSKRAKERRSRHSRMTRHQRAMMAQQHWGDFQGSERDHESDSDTKLASLLGLEKKGM